MQLSFGGLCVGKAKPAAPAAEDVIGGALTDVEQGLRAKVDAGGDVAEGRADGRDGTASDDVLQR